MVLAASGNHHETSWFAWVGVKAYATLGSYKCCCSRIWFDNKEHGLAAASLVAKHGYPRILAEPHPSFLRAGAVFATGAHGHVGIQQQVPVELKSQPLALVSLPHHSHVHLVGIDTPDHLLVHQQGCDLSSVVTQAGSSDAFSTAYICWVPLHREWQQGFWRFASVVIVEI